MSGRWQIKHPGLRPLAAKAAALVRRFDSMAFTWIPRERNRHADALANAAMDAAEGKRPGKSAFGSGAGRPDPKDEPPASVLEPEPVSVVGQAPGAVVKPAPGLAVGPGAWEPPTESADRHATRLILVRHGETALTAQRRYSGRGDVELSDRGLTQARAAAGRIAGLVGATRIAAVVSSPLARCTQTAQLIAAAAGDPPVVVEADLVECDFGDWEGRTFAEVRAQWPVEMDAWLASTSVAPPGGESLRAVSSRVRRVMAKLRESYPGSAVVVVSHVSPLKLMLRDALAASDAFLHRLYLDPTGISIVDSWVDGGVAVRTVNDTAHLAG
jgi:probable phosphoglycerate mutase